MVISIAHSFFRWSEKMLHKWCAVLDANSLCVCLGVGGDDGDGGRVGGLLGDGRRRWKGSNVNR